MSEREKKKKTEAEWRELEERVQARIEDLKSQEATIKEMRAEEEIAHLADDVPIGTMVAFSKKASPLYLKCDGKSYYQKDYPALYALLLTHYGCDDADDEPNFRVPDMRGRFPRGCDDGAERDKDHAARTHPFYEGTVVGDQVGSVQDEAVNTSRITVEAVGNHSHGGSTGNAGKHSHEVGMHRGDHFKCGDSRAGIWYYSLDSTRHKTTE